MFGLLRFLFKVAIYLGAPLTILLAVFAGPAALTALLPDAPPLAGYLIGAVLGTLLAALVFGLPLILLRIHANLLEVMAKLEQLQQPALPPPVPSLVDTVLLPAMAERTLDRLLGD